MDSSSAQSGVRRGLRGLAPAAAVLGVSLLALVGCGGGGGPTVPSLLPTLPPASGLSAPPTPAFVYPLTGLPAGTGAAASALPVVVLVAGGPGTTGLGAADVLFEEFDGTGVTRVLAMYQSKDATGVGPVIATRPADSVVVSLVRPVVANTGGPAGFVQQLDGSTVIDASSARHPSLYRNPGPVVDTAALRGLGRPLTQGAILSYQQTGDALSPSNQTATKLVVSVPGYPTQTWTYSVGTQAWTSPGQPWLPPVASLVLQTVPYKSVLLHHPAGQAVQTAKVLGTGTCVAVSGGFGTNCTWSKVGVTGVTNYADPTGNLVRLRAGRTIIMLVPAGTKATVS
jgi:hypothetical protein